MMFRVFAGIGEVEEYLDLYEMSDSDEALEKIAKVSAANFRNLHPDVDGDVFMEVYELDNNGNVMADPLYMDYDEAAV